MPAAGGTTQTGLLSLVVDGKACGLVKSAGGGDLIAPVVDETAGPDGFVSKRLGTPVCDDITLQIGLEMDGAVYDWIAATWNRDFTRHNAAIQAADLNGRVTSNREFANVLPTALTVPVLDAASKDAGWLGVTLKAEAVTAGAATGTLSAHADPKKWLLSNFRLEVDGLDCSSVNRIESLSVVLETVEDAVGSLRQPTLEPGRLDFPNLTVSLGESHAQTWAAWFDAFVVKGNNGTSQEKSGAIVFLAPDLKSELGRVLLHGVGICALREPVEGAGAQQIARVSAELYCQRMELAIPSGAPAPAPAPVPPVVNPTPQPEPIHVVPRPPIGPR